MNFPAPVLPTPFVSVPPSSQGCSGRSLTTTVVLSWLREPCVPALGGTYGSYIGIWLSLRLVNIASARACLHACDSLCSQALFLGALAKDTHTHTHGSNHSFSRANVPFLWVSSHAYQFPPHCFLPFFSDMTTRCGEEGENKP